MASWSYQAKSFNGKVVNGSIDAESEAEARVKIRAKKLIPIRVASGSSGASARQRVQTQITRGRVKSKDLQVFTRQLSVLISSGVPLVQALDVLSQSPRGKALDYALENIVREISEGKKLGAAFGNHPSVFGKFYVNMLIAGEEGGVLDQVLARLAEYIEKSVKLQRKVKGAMAYPVVVLFISLAVVTGLLVFVIPKFVSIFEGNGQKIPWLTQMVIDASDYFVANWYFIFGGAIGLFIALRYYYNTPNGRRVVDNYLIKVPVFGSFIVKKWNG